MLARPCAPVSDDRVDLQPRASAQPILQPTTRRHERRAALRVADQQTVAQSLEVVGGSVEGVEELRPEWRLEQHPAMSGRPVGEDLQLGGGRQRAGPDLAAGCNPQRDLRHAQRRVELGHPVG